METDRIRMDTDSDISDNHIFVSFQFPSLRIETDRIRTDTNSDISDIFGYPFSCFLTVSIPREDEGDVLDRGFPQPPLRIFMGKPWAVWLPRWLSTSVKASECSCCFATTLIFYFYSSTYIIQHTCLYVIIYQIWTWLIMIGWSMKCCC